MQAFWHSYFSGMSLDIQLVHERGVVMLKNMAPESVLLEKTSVLALSGSQQPQCPTFSPYFPIVYSLLDHIMII